jgi:hypothetical protein
MDGRIQNAAWMMGILLPIVHCRRKDSMKIVLVHPQGFGQHGRGLIGKHNGKRIKFEELPPDCQRLVMRDLES